MKALVIYESMFGNTERIARAIADGLHPAFEVTVADVSVTPSPAGADLIVIGGPTHVLGMSHAKTREDAQRQGATRPDAVPTGIRDWLGGSPDLTGVAAAAFDTRMRSRFAGSAARKADKQLRRLGCRTVARAESFLVSGTAGPLVDGEEDRARRWGASLATTAGGPRRPTRAR